MEARVRVRVTSARLRRCSRSTASAEQPEAGSDAQCTKRNQARGRSDGGSTPGSRRASKPAATREGGATSCSHSSHSRCR